MRWHGMGENQTLSLMSLPDRHRSGITFSKSLELAADYPLATHTVTLLLRGPTNDNIVGVADPEDSANILFEKISPIWNAGVHKYQIVAVETATGKTFEVCPPGSIRIEENVSLINQDTDQRSHIDAVIEELEKLILVRITGGALVSEEIGTETVRKHQNEPLETLQNLLAEYRSQRARQKRRQRGDASPWQTCEVSI